MTHVDMIEDGHGNLVDVLYYCSAHCYNEAHEESNGGDGSTAYGHAWPAPSWPDYPVQCSNPPCGMTLHEGTEE